MEVTWRGVGGHTETMTLLQWRINMMRNSSSLGSWFTSSATGEASGTTHCLCLSSGSLASWPSSPWPPVTREESRRKQTQRRGVRPAPRSQNTGSFFVIRRFWLTPLLLLWSRTALIRFVSAGHHYKCMIIANYFWYTCALNNQTAETQWRTSREIKILAS